MKYSERDELVSSLRELADFFEARGVEVPVPAYGIISISTWVSVYNYETDPENGDSNLDEAATKARLQRIARALGRCEKDYNSYSFKLTKMFGERVKLVYEANRDAVCEKKQVGTKTVPNFVSVEQGTKEEPIYEVICKPLMED